MKIKDEAVKSVQRFREGWINFIRREIQGEIVPPVPMVNNGYLHTLNASFDGLFLREQQTDSLLTANYPMNFGTIQPCIRTEDKAAVKKSLLHLGLFEICGFSILDLNEDRLTAEKMAEKTIGEFLKFYCQYSGLDPGRLKIFYFGGGTLRAVSGGKIDSGDYVEADDFSVTLWRKLGLKDIQLIPERSNETFLLHLGSPVREHHSGYRNDIFIKLKDACYEVATLNFISHKTVLNNNRIVGIRSLPFSLREMAVGQERWLAALNGMANIYELPQIKPLLDAVTLILDDEDEAMQVMDSLRVIHYFFADGWTYDRLAGKKYREHRHDINKFMEVVSRQKNLCQTQIGELLRLNAQLQPWHPKLQTSVPAVLNEIKKYGTTRSMVR